MRAVMRGIRRTRSVARAVQLRAFNGRAHNQILLCNNDLTSSINIGLKHFEISRQLLSTSASRISTGDSLADLSIEKEQGGPLLEYQRKIKRGELMAGDECQEQTLKALQRLYNELVASAESCGLERSGHSEERSSRSWFWFMSPQIESSSIRGLYLFGGVGTGKTMLMDMFYDQLPRTWRKKRIHFHDFMLGVHSRLQKHTGVNDPLEAVAEEITNDSLLLCLDEFMVTDVADALILYRLFGHLFRKGLILVATSNRAPENLYEGGLQRNLFLPFIPLIKERCIVHAIESATDYRKLTSAEQGFYFVGKQAAEMLKDKFEFLINGHSAISTTVEVVMGRKLQVPLGANGCAYFQFSDLCDKPLGAADYFGLFKHFHTLALEGVPVFGAHNRTAAYRFVTLIDVMYENRARLLCSAEASPIQLLEQIVTIDDAKRSSPRTSRVAKSDNVDLCVDNELGFAKDRTISRLTEMNSKEYLEEHALTHAESEVSGSKSKPPKSCYLF